MALGHGGQQVEHTAGDQPEVAGIERDLDIGHAADQAIEGGGGGALEQALAVALTALAVDHVGAPLPVHSVHERHHVGQELGRVLQVGIDDQDALAAAQGEPGGERELMAVVAHQAHRDDTRVLRRGLGHDLPGAVVAAVVDQHDLALPADAIQYGADPAQELGQDVLLVVARSHHGQGRAVGGNHGGAIDDTGAEAKVTPLPAVSLLFGARTSRSTHES
jgi:hypothetical protein